MIDFSILSLLGEEKDECSHHFLKLINFVVQLEIYISLKLFFVKNNRLVHAVYLIRKFGFGSKTAGGFGTKQFNKC